MSIFDYVKYDSHAESVQAMAKEAVTRIEEIINATIGKVDPKPSIRAKSIALTKLEECYMWIGKAIRDDQKFRNDMVVLNEERDPSGAV